MPGGHLYVSSGKMFIQVPARFLNVLFGFLLLSYVCSLYFFPFSLFVTVYVYASLCDFVCVALLLPFVLGFCLSGFSFAFFFTF